MVLKTIALCQLFLLAFAYCGAQNPSFQWSDPLPASGGTIKLVGQKNDLLFVSYNKNNKEVLLRSYNATLRVQNETQFLFEKKSDTSYLVSFLSDTQVVSIFTVSPRKKKETDLVVVKSSIDFSNKTAPVLLASFKDGTGTDFSFSNDKSKLAVFNSRFFVRSFSSEINFTVLSTGTSQVIHEGSIEIERSVTQNVNLDDYGNIYFDNSESYREGSKVFGRTKIKQVIHIVFADGTKQQYTLAPDGKYFPGIDFVQADSGQVVMTGFAYDEDVKASRLSVIDWFRLRIDPAKKTVVDSLYVPVDGMFPARKLNAEDRLPYSIRKIYRRKNGGHIIVAEQEQVIVGQYAATVKLNDMACVYLKSDWSVESVTRIPKLQFGDASSSLASAAIDDKIYLLYSDNMKNLEASENKLVYQANKPEKNGLFLITVTPGSEYKKQLLYGFDDKHPVPFILMGQSLDALKIFFPGTNQFTIAAFAE
jgi:hypothetical protein